MSVLELRWHQGQPAGGVSTTQLSPSYTVQTTMHTGHAGWTGSRASCVRSKRKLLTPEWFPVRAHTEVRVWSLKINKHILVDLKNNKKRQAVYPLGSHREQFPLGCSLTKELAGLQRSHSTLWTAFITFPQGGRGSWSLARGLGSHMPHAPEGNSEPLTLRYGPLGPALAFFSIYSEFLWHTCLSLSC